MGTFETMIEQNAMVIYKEHSRKLYGNCGIVEAMVTDQPDYVLVRWLGETSSRKEHIENLELV